MNFLNQVLPQAEKYQGTALGQSISFDGYDLEVNESEMSLWVPFADGNRRDGVGDLLEIGGIDTSRHQLNPLVLFDHGKQVQLPVAVAQDPKTGVYCVELDVANRRARGKAFFYQCKPKFDDFNSYQDWEAASQRLPTYEHALFCEQLFDLVVKKFIRAGSIGYQVKQARELPPNYETGTPKGLHLIQTLLLEFSVVVLPANADTVGKVLGDGHLCGKKLSPYLVKSLMPYVAPRKAVMGYEGKANQPPRAEHAPEVEAEAREHRNRRRRDRQTELDPNIDQDTNWELWSRDYDVFHERPGDEMRENISGPHLPRDVYEQRRAEHILSTPEEFPGQHQYARMALPKKVGEKGQKANRKVFRNEIDPETGDVVEVEVDAPDYDQRPAYALRGSEWTNLASENANYIHGTNVERNRQRQVERGDRQHQRELEKGQKASWREHDQREPEQAPQETPEQQRARLIAGHQRVNNALRAGGYNDAEHQLLQPEELLDQFGHRDPDEFLSGRQNRANRFLGVDPANRTVGDFHAQLEGKSIDRIPGGLADGKPTTDFNSEQLKAGIRVEMEHTDDPDVAREIAMDHLSEDPDYYRKLETIEKGFARRKDFTHPELQADANEGNQMDRVVFGDRAVSGQSQGQTQPTQPTPPSPRRSGGSKGLKSLRQLYRKKGYQPYQTPLGPIYDSANDPKTSMGRHAARIRGGDSSDAVSDPHYQEMVEDLRSRENPPREKSAEPFTDGIPPQEPNKDTVSPSHRSKVRWNEVANQPPGNKVDADIYDEYLKTEDAINAEPPPGPGPGINLPRALRQAGRRARQQQLAEGLESYHQEKSADQPPIRTGTPQAAKMDTDKTDEQWQQEAVQAGTASQHPQAVAQRAGSPIRINTPQAARLDKGLKSLRKLYRVKAAPNSSGPDREKTVREVLDTPNASPVRYRIPGYSYHANEHRGPGAEADFYTSPAGGTVQERLSRPEYQQEGPPLERGNGVPITSEDVQRGLSGGKDFYENKIRPTQEQEAEAAQMRNAFNEGRTLGRTTDDRPQRRISESEVPWQFRRNLKSLRQLYRKKGLVQNEESNRINIANAERARKEEFEYDQRADTPVEGYPERYTQRQQRAAILQSARDAAFPEQVPEILARLPKKEDTLFPPGYQGDKSHGDLVPVPLHRLPNTKIPQARFRQSGPGLVRGEKATPKWRDLTPAERDQVRAARDFRQVQQERTDESQFWHQMSQQHETQPRSNEEHVRLGGESNERSAERRQRADDAIERMYPPYSSIDPVEYEQQRFNEQNEKAIIIPRSTRERRAEGGYMQRFDQLVKDRQDGYLSDEQFRQKLGELRQSQDRILTAKQNYHDQTRAKGMKGTDMDPALDVRSILHSADIYDPEISHEHGAVIASVEHDRADDAERALRQLGRGYTIQRNGPHLAVRRNQGNTTTQQMHGKAMGPQDQTNPNDTRNMLDRRDRRIARLEREYDRVTHGGEWSGNEYDSDLLRRIQAGEERSERLQSESTRRYQKEEDRRKRAAEEGQQGETEEKRLHYSSKATDLMPDHPDKRVRDMAAEQERLSHDSNLDTGEFLDKYRGLNRAARDALLSSDLHMSAESERSKNPPLKGMKNLRSLYRKQTKDISEVPHEVIKVRSYKRRKRTGEE